MNLDVFQALAETALDFRAVFLSAQAARREAGSIIEGINERLNVERDQRDQRLLHLRAKAADTGRSDTIRRLSADEAAELEKQQLGPSVVEAEAFQSAVDECEQAARDAGKLREELLKQFEAARRELADLREATLADQQLDPALLQRHPDSLREEWDALLQRWGTQ